MTNKHILFTARDIGAAYHIEHIIEAFKAARFRASLVASGMAYEFFKSKKLNPRHFLIKDNPVIPNNSKGKLMGQLLKSSHEVISGIRPDAVFCGLSSSGYGIDEAILYWAASDRLRIPAFQFLDAWGTFNCLKDGYPDIYFVIDNDFQKYSHKGAVAPMRTVGSPKHERYRSKPILRWKSDLRRRMKIDRNTKLIGYFGQDPDIPGHAYNFECLLKTVKEYSRTRPCKLLVRAHPAHKSAYGYYRDWTRKMRIATVDINEGVPVEEVISACDLVTTCFSTVGLDHAYLTAYAGEYIGAVLYLLCGKEIKAHMRSSFGYWRVPPLERGIGFYADDEASLSAKMEALLGDHRLQVSYLNATRSIDKGRSCERIVTTVRGLI